ncbi:uncharacterized protein LOC103519401 [Diaphorina citri]|uniref:Uncharacterized protein LOC103519401 n=1 Tax=Diaphorina citri TaxID=121845 RepID=A0A3Q0JDZ9_DIACI|nr:uncharacterized protein LOC103519401 [Diaphorina citri]
MYSCIWMKKRGLNVLEFQLGLKSSNHLNTSLCSDFNFQSTKWITQGRLERYQEAPCPITGEYHGMIPDTDGLCAKLSSDCTSPETMYYTVVDCNAPEIYEGQVFSSSTTMPVTSSPSPNTYPSYIPSSPNTRPTYVPSRLPSITQSYSNDNIARNPAPYHATESSYFGGLSHFDFKNSHNPSPPDFRIPINYNVKILYRRYATPSSDHGEVHYNNYHIYYYHYNNHYQSPMDSSYQENHCSYQALETSDSSSPSSPRRQSGKLCIHPKSYLISVHSYPDSFSSKLLPSVEKSL